MINKIDSDSGDIDWNQSLDLPNGMHVSQLGREPLAGATFSELPPTHARHEALDESEKRARRFPLRQSHHHDLQESSHRIVFQSLASPRETFGPDWFTRHMRFAMKKSNELQDSYAKKIETLEDRIARAMGLRLLSKKPRLSMRRWTPQCGLAEPFSVPFSGAALVVEAAVQ